MPAVTDDAGSGLSVFLGKKNTEMGQETLLNILQVMLENILLMTVLKN